MPSQLEMSWQARGGVLKRRGHPDQGGTTGGPVIIPDQLAGSAPVGTTTYAVPATNVLFVDPVNGVDTNSGSITGPLKTCANAFTKVAIGGTIVLRGGTYHEGVIYVDSTNNGYGGIQLRTANVTVQSYPNEAVWFDGSVVVSGWVIDGSMWRHDGWTVKLDRSPTFTFGVPDSTTPGWNFVSPLYPTAAWPEQLFMDGLGKTQVASKAAVVPGTFFIDQSAGSVYVGDNPNTHEVRITDLQVTICAIATGCIFRGLGFRRFAPSQPHIGSVKLFRDNCLIENCVFEDISSIALSFQTGSNMKGKNLSLTRVGCIGIHANNADNLELYRCRMTYCNNRFFNYAPASGGAKITRQRGFTMHECVSNDNYCKGLWTDESVSNITVYNNDFLRNEQRGVSFELSGITYFCNNLIVSAGYNGLDFLTSDELHAWNNTIVSFGSISPDRFGVSRGDARGFDAIQDNRGPMNSSSVGLDTRYTIAQQQAVGMDWVMTNVEIKNTIISKMGVVGQLIIGIEDYNKNSGTARDKSAYGVDWDGNFYNRIDSSHPTWLSILPNAGSANVTVYFDINGLKAAGFDPHSTEVTGLDALNGDYTIKSPYKATADANARPLPSNIAALVGQPVGTLHVGCWR